MSIVSDLTSFEVAEAEKASGVAYQTLSNRDAPKVALWGALAWQYTRRTQPDLTHDEFMKTHSPNAVLGILYPDDEDESAEVDEDGFPDSEGGSAVDRRADEPAGEAGDGEGEVRPGDGGPAE